MRHGSCGKDPRRMNIPESVYTLRSHCYQQRCQTAPDDVCLEGRESEQGALVHEDAS